MLYVLQPYHDPSPVPKAECVSVSCTSENMKGFIKWEYFNFSDLENNSLKALFINEEQYLKIGNSYNEDCRVYYDSSLGGFSFDLKLGDCGMKLESDNSKYINFVQSFHYDNGVVQNKLNGIIKSGAEFRCVLDRKIKLVSNQLETHISDTTQKFSTFQAVNFESDFSMNFYTNSSFGEKIDHLGEFGTENFVKINWDGENSNSIFQDLKFYVDICEQVPTNDSAEFNENVYKIVDNGVYNELIGGFNLNSGVTILQNKNSVFKFLTFETESNRSLKRLGFIKYLQNESYNDLNSSKNQKL